MLGYIPHQDQEQTPPLGPGADPLLGPEADPPGPGADPPRSEADTLPLPLDQQQMAPAAVGMQ